MGTKSTTISDDRVENEQIFSKKSREFHKNYQIQSNIYPFSPNKFDRNGSVSQIHVPKRLSNLQKCHIVLTKRKYHCTVDGLGLVGKIHHKEEFDEHLGANDNTSRTQDNSAIISHSFTFFNISNDLLPKQIHRSSHSNCSHIQ